DGAAEDAADGVGATGHCQEQNGSYWRAGHAEEDDGHTPRDRGDNNGQPMAMDVRRPAAGRGSDEGTQRGRRVQKAKHFGTAHAFGDRGKQGRGHAEKHRHDVDDIRAYQLWLAPSVVEALQDTTDARAFGAFG